MARATWLHNVLDDLRTRGVPVHVVAGCDTRGTTTFDPRGIICHDTGGSATSSDAGEINVLLNGSATAPAPIAQFYLSRTTGVHLVATGRCNHALTGKAGPLKGLGNSNLIGIEAAANPGRPWPPQQYAWYVQLVAAICRNRGWNPHQHVAAHREHQPGQKIDPQGVDMAQFRAAVAAAITNPTQGDDDMATALELWNHDLLDDIGGIKRVEPAYKTLLRAADGVDALRAASAASAQREQDTLTALKALADALKAGGGSVDVAAILARIDARTADVTGTIAQLQKELAATRKRLADALAGNTPAA